MSWVLLSLRKSELKMVHSDYVAQDLQISRAQRREARHYQVLQRAEMTAQRKELAPINQSYKQQRQAIYDQMKQLRENYKNMPDEQKYTETNGIKHTVTIDDLRINNKDMTTLQQELAGLQEEHEEELDAIKTFHEDALADIEEEANDVEAQFEQDKVMIETQMEAVSQELQAVTQAISQQIQNETIKLS